MPHALSDFSTFFSSLKFIFFLSPALSTFTVLRVLRLRDSSSSLMKLLWLLLLICTSPSTAQIDGIFYNPAAPGTSSDFTENPQYQVGSLVQLRWSVTWDRISLCLTQNGNRNYEFLLPNVTNTNNYDWIVSTSQNTSNENVFSLSIYDPGTHDSFNSHYFNLTDASVVASATTLPSASVATTTDAVNMTPDMATQASATISAAVAATQTFAPAVTSSGPMSSSTNGWGGGHHNFTGNDNDGDHNGLDPTTKIGIGIGLGVGIPLFIALGIAAGWMLRSSHKKRKAAGQPSRWQASWTSPRKESKRRWMPFEKPKTYQKMPISPPMPLNVQELPGPQFIYELPNGVTPRSTMVPAVKRKEPPPKVDLISPARSHRSTSKPYFDPAVIRGSISSYEF
ncbi:hypothetical protein MMC11_002562 [Xylographa trunciseda]|nr:hypothetical protein [Xylographa trunciseda]